jgi:hypothetical protein
MPLVGMSACPVTPSRADAARWTAKVRDLHGLDPVPLRTRTIAAVA